jgi:hypothetical protein
MDNCKTRNFRKDFFMGARTLPIDEQSSSRSFTPSSPVMQQLSQATLQFEQPPSRSSRPSAVGRNISYNETTTILSNSQEPSQSNLFYRLSMPPSLPHRTDTYQELEPETKYLAQIKTRRYCCGCFSSRRTCCGTVCCLLLILLMVWRMKDESNR